ncbi:hypothetical protein [Desulfatibacillum aliphaticivorans]|uniref:hypothetical protein n=1 Tax=Desulfatibacillum aliphaticivorans TaxID=218208 RepID=UPI0004892ED5|nr:hypothetical protein [Desulfatibacillum aliphaticivorans]
MNSQRWTILILLVLLSFFLGRFSVIGMDHVSMPEEILLKNAPERFNKYNILSSIPVSTLKELNFQKHTYAYWQIVHAERLLSDIPECAERLEPLKKSLLDQRELELKNIEKLKNDLGAKNYLVMYDYVDASHTGHGGFLVVDKRGNIKQDID